VADKTIAFTLKVNGVDQAVSSIDELDSSIQQLEETLKSAKFGTDEFKAVEQQLIKARSAKEDLDKSLEGRGAEKRLQGIVGLAEGLGGAFAVASQASALFGKESADLAKVEAKAQQALAVVMGIRAIKEGLLNSALERKIILEKASMVGTALLNGVNKALNITLSMNPIGLIVTALGLLVVGILAAIGPIKKIIGQFDFLGEAIQWTIDKARDLASVLSFGLIDDAATAKTRDNSEKMIESLDDASSAANKNIAAQKRRLDLMAAQGATEEQLLEQKKKINQAEVDSRQKAVNALMMLQKMDGELDDDKKKKLNELQEEIKDLNNQALIDQADFNKNKADKEKEATDKANDKAKEAADKAKELREKTLEEQKKALDKIKELQDAFYLDSIKDQDQRAQEALKLTQAAADKEIQIQLDTLNKKKTLTKEEKALKATLIEEQKALDAKQAQDTQALLDEQAKVRAEKEKAYNAELLGLRNELTLMSIENETERSLKELEIALAQQVQEINSRQLTEAQKTALIENAALINAEKVKAIEEGQAQATADFKFSLMEEGYQKELAQVDIDKEAKIEQLNALKLTEEEYAAASVDIERQAAEAKQAINTATLNAQLGATAGVLGQAASLFGENTIAFKALKIAETGITTYQSATSAFASVVGIPVVGPVLAPIAAGVAVASGLASIAKIAGIGVPKPKVTAPSPVGGGGGGTGGGGGSKFAMGGLVVGPGSGTSDSIPAMLSAGESVINARSTEMFGGLLSTLNQAGGGNEIPNNGGTPIIKTYVVASDMTSQQEADRRINDIARI
jgi:hypothetical protein